eukprot:s961_g8.t1
MATPSSEELFGSPRARAADPGQPSSPTAAGPAAGPPGAAMVGATQWGQGLIDTRAYRKLRTFSGKEEDWATWSFVARSYLDLLSMGFRELLVDAEAAGQASEIRMVDMTPMARTHSWTLFDVLTQSVEGRALSVLMNSEASNGLQAWRMLVDAYEPKVGGRWTAMLMGILSPQWAHLKETDFLESLDTWETPVRRYEEQSKEVVTEATKLAVVMKHAPGGLRSALRTSSSAKRDTGGPAPMEVGAISWKGGTPKGGKKGKNEKGGKGKKGKSEKGKDKGVKGKSKSSGSTQFNGYCSYGWKWGRKKSECRAREKEKKGKGASTNAVDKKEDAGGTNAVQYRGLGNYEDWDPEQVMLHKHATGKWPRIEKEETGATSSTNLVTTSTRGIPRQSWADQEDEDEDEWYEEEEEEENDNPDRVVGALKEVSSVEDARARAEHEKFIMFDSGSDEHVCTESFGRKGEEQKSRVKLNAVSGDALAILGERKVIITLAGRKGPVDIEVVFQVSRNSQKNILSSGKLFRAGFRTLMDCEGQSYLEHASVGDQIPLYMYGNSFYVRLMEVKTVPMVTRIPHAIVAPVSEEADAEAWENVGLDAEGAEEEIPMREVEDRFIESRMRLTPQSTIREMRERLKALGYVVKAPAGPTAEERAKHNLTHLPTATWCEHCAKGKGREAPHARTDGERAVVQIDYSYLKADGSYEETTEDPAVVVLTAADPGTGLFTALSIPTKNFEKDYMVKSLKAFVSQLGHIRITIRSDGEPTILQVSQELRDELNKPRGKEAEVKAHLEQAPRYSHQTMGAVGAAQRTLKGDFLTLMSDLKEKANLRTAYEDAFGGQYTGQILPFGEVLLFKVPHSATGRKAGGRILKGDSTWERGIFLGKVNETDEFLVGNIKGVHSVRTVRRLEERMRWSAEAVTGFKGVPWNRETTIGRPRKAIAPEVVQAPAAAPKPTTPKPMLGLTGPAQQQARGKAEKRSEEKPEEEKAKKAKVFTDSSERLEPIEASHPDAMGSGLDRSRRRNSEEDREAVEQAVKRWKQQEEVVEARMEGGPSKKLKIGEQTIGALFSAVEDPVEGIEWPEEVEIDEDPETMLVDGEDEVSWENVPITDEERAEGMEKELNKMDQFETYKPVPRSEVTGKILDSTWVEARKPDGSVRMRLIDLIGVLKTQVFFTADATNAFWQVPIEEECYMYPPKSWIEREKRAGRPTDVLWRLLKEWYGRRVAGTRWVKFAAGKIMKAGCLRSEFAPWLFHHPRLDISLELHMDDIYGCGPKEAVKSFLEELHKELKIKSEIHEPVAGGSSFAQAEKLLDEKEAQKYNETCV